MTEKLKAVKHAIVGVACCILGVMALLMEFYPTLVSKLAFFELLLPVYDFFKTTSVVVNTFLFVLLSIYGAVCIVQSAVGFKIYKRDKKLRKPS
ncbi:hypothetical protein ACFL53_05240 [Pseudomonadota bacterium]